MEKFDELLTKLKKANITQIKMDWIENIPEDMYNEYFENEDYDEIQEGLDIDTHRWYETSTQVIKIYNRYLGINSITNMFSESSSPDDIGYTILFFEMEPVQVVSYKKK
jgi:hypothetical protein